jgi:hypothetical protein
MTPPPGDGAESVPCAGADTIRREVTSPLQPSKIDCGPPPLATTDVFTHTGEEAAGVSVIVIVAVFEVPPGPVAVNVNESEPA